MSQDIVVKQAIEEIKALRAEPAGCKADAERYRWLRAQVADPDSEWCVYKVSAEPNPDLDAAIDAARAESTKGEKCIGYGGGCDGNLVGETHIAECPARTKESPNG